MEKIILQASPRDLLGKKVKTLRASGTLPAHVYGKGLNSAAVAVTAKDFATALSQAGETGLVELTVAGEDSSRPVLIQGVQKDPVTGNPLHVDLYQVNLKEKTTAKVPVVLTGENELEKRSEGLIIQTLNEIEVEALPTDIPHEFTVDTTALTEIGQTFKVSDLSYDHEKVTVKVDPEENILVMQVAEMKEEEVPVAEAPAEEVVVLSEEEAKARAAEAGSEEAPAAGEETPKAEEPKA
jgi:large subunit ribosomal protein L25